MPLPLRGYNYTNGYIGQGYSYLRDIFAQLPELETVDFGVTIPEPLQELLQPAESERKIVFAESENSFFNAITLWEYNGYNIVMAKIRTEQEDILFLSLEELKQIEMEKDKYEEVMLELEDIAVYLDSEEVFDCEILADFKNLKTLTIYGSGSSVLLTLPTSQVIHLETLAGLPYLGALSLYNVQVDLSGLAKFQNLRELYLTSCDIKGTFGLQKLPLLRELSLIGISDDDGMRVSWADMWKNMPELCYFHGFFKGNDEYKSISDFSVGMKAAEKLQTMVLDVAGSAGADVMRDLLSQIPDELALNNLFLDLMGDTIDLAQVKCTDSLENFFCNSKTDHLAEFISTHPNLIAVTAMGIPDMPDEDALAAYYNDAIEAAVKSSKLSMLDMFSSGNMANLDHVRERVDWLSLYEAGIYDDQLQLGAFLRDIDVDTYYQEWMP